MNLASTTFWSALATALRIGAGLVAVKFVALMGGPSGVALLGQFQNFVQIVTGLSGSLFQNGTVKFSSQYRLQPERLSKYTGTMIWVAIMISVAATLALVIFHNQLAKLVMHDENHGLLFLCLGALISLLVVNGIAMGLLNGLGSVRNYLIITGLGNVVFMLSTLAFTYSVGVHGALYAVVASPALVAFVSMIALRPHWKVIRSGLLSGIDLDELVNIAKFALMGLAGMLALPLALLGIRNQLVEQLGWIEAGYWQAVWQISVAYLAIFTTGLSVYYLPKLSGMQDVQKIRQELKAYFNLILPLAVLISFLVFIFRDFILQVLYSDQFLVAENILFWQLCADIVRVATWGYGYLLVAKGISLAFISKEMVFAALFYLISSAMLPHHGLAAVGQVYLVLCVLHGFFVVFVVKKFLAKEEALAEKNRPSS